MLAAPGRRIVSQDTIRHPLKLHCTLLPQVRERFFTLLPFIQARNKSSFSKLLFERDHETTRSIIPSTSIRLHKSPPLSKEIAIELDGGLHNISNVFLRDTCQCSKCVDPVTTQKTYNTGDIEPNVKPEAIRVINNSLEIIWDDNHHRSIYPATLLTNYISRDAATAARFNDLVPFTWDSASIKGQDIRVLHKSFMENESSVHAAIQNLAKFGLCFLEDCPSGPNAETQLQLIAERIGPLKNTFYGPTWNVKAIEAAKNVAYTSVDLDLHMDLLYYESPPGLQFLHCLENQVERGASVFVDSFEAAEIMRKQHPDEFKFLCDYSVDFKYENDGVYYHQARPTFVLDPVTKVLQYVNYSPPFQGIQVSRDFQQYHTAIAIFAKLIRQASLRHELVLKEGQCVIFNNRRTLHARKSFGPGKRWLKGAYCDIDALWSKYRTGQRELRS